MDHLDDATFARFAGRFARIEQLIPDPPRRAFAPVVTGRSGPASIPRRAVLLGVVAVLAVLAALTALGSRPAPRLTIPPDAAPAPVVLDAYLRALQVGDCKTAHQLTMPLVLDKGFTDLCGVTRVTGFTIVGESVVVDPYTVRLTATLAITGTANGDISPGAITATYFLQQQSTGAWRIINGGIHVPPSMLNWPSPSS
jgi:hypothetical protein